MATIKPKPKPKKKKTNSLLSQAQKLGEGKYAPALSQIESNLRSNQALYGSASNQRVQNLNREVGSITAAGQSANKNISDLGAHSQSLYQDAMSKSQKNNTDLLDKINSNNSSMLSSLQAEMRARGMTDYERLSPLTQDMHKRSELLAAMGQFGLNRLNEIGASSNEATKSKQFMSEMMKNTDISGAKGAAQSNLNELYNKFLEARLGLEGQKTSTKLEKEDYINQTYLTLKDRAAQNKAAMASAQAGAASAAANLAYKYEALKVNTKFKYDQLSSKTAQNDIANIFKEQGFAHKVAMDQANLILKKAQATAKPGQNVDLNNIVAEAIAKANLR